MFSSSFMSFVLNMVDNVEWLCVFREILNGIAVTDENGNKLGHSTVWTNLRTLKNKIKKLYFA